MASRHKLDSENGAVRFIERWKRGAAVAILVSVALILPSIIASKLAQEAIAWLGGSPWAQTVAGALGLAIAGPLVIGSRSILETLGRLALARDS